MHVSNKEIRTFQKGDVIRLIRPVWIRCPLSKSEYFFNTSNAKRPILFMFLCQIYSSSEKVSWMLLSPIGEILVVDKNVHDFAKYFHLVVGS